MANWERRVLHPTLGKFFLLFQLGFSPQQELWVTFILSETRFLASFTLTCSLLEVCRASHPLLALHFQVLKPVVLFPGHPAVLSCLCLPMSLWLAWSLCVDMAGLPLPPEHWD